MAEWFDVTKLRPLDNNTHGRTRVISYWPLHRIDEDGNMTAECVGGVQHIVDYCSVGNGGWFEDPDAAGACGDWFGDDYCYAKQPSHWAACIANPDGSLVERDISHIDGQPVETART